MVWTRLTLAVEYTGNCRTRTTRAAFQSWLPPLKRASATSRREGGGVNGKGSLSSDSDWQEAWAEDGSGVTAPEVSAQAHPQEVLASG